MPPLITTGIVPNKFKLGNIIPVYKNGSRNIKSNYRPISLLSVFNKLLEKVQKRLGTVQKLKEKYYYTANLHIAGTFHQGDEHFNVQSRGKQCAFMSLSAVLTAHNIPVIDWSKTTLDNVLLQGDKMYLKALNRGLIVLHPGVEFLSVDNLPKVVSIPCCSNIFSHEI